MSTIDKNVGIYYKAIAAFTSLLKNVMNMYSTLNTIQIPDGRSFKKNCNFGPHMVHLSSPFDVQTTVKYKI